MHPIPSPAPPAHRLLAAALLATLAASLHAPAADPGYNLPGTVTGNMPADEVMRKMETAVAPEVLAAFKQANPARFWLFGEDRQLAVRNRVIPAHWFENGAKHYQQFSGTARPGEFYVFQVCIVPGEDLGPMECKVEIASLGEAEPVVVSGLGWYGNKGWYFLPPATQTERDTVRPVWIGIQIPVSANQGAYTGKVRFRPDDDLSTIGREKAQFPEVLEFTLRIAGEPISDLGVNDAWRLARLKWLNSDIGRDQAAVTRPFVPIKLNESARTIDILGRRLKIAPNGIPEQITSFFSKSNSRILQSRSDAFASPPRFECIREGNPLKWDVKETSFTLVKPTSVWWNAESVAGDLTLQVTGRLEYDGYLNLNIDICDFRRGRNNPPIQLDDVRFTLPWRNEIAQYAMGLGLQGGRCPSELNWKWDVTKHQDAIWLGDVNLGAMLRFKDPNYKRPLINAYYDFRPLRLPESWGTGGISIRKNANSTDLTAFSGPKQIVWTSKGGDHARFLIDWYLTPFKPLDVKQHFTDRYYHVGQAAGFEDTKKLRAEGANIIEIHHNRLCNPYINYPYNSDSFGYLQEFVKKAHGDGMRVNLYYTTRELTQNLPEFFALKSMGGEIILPRKEGVPWPVTNPQGPHPWLKEHVGEDIVPAWRENLKFPEIKEKLDLAVITTPDSRWNNFYLEGLDYLIKKAGIDGLYIDDTALDRQSMQRARRILDADGNTGRRVSMHSWNHFNGLAKWSNSAIAFMELYPYYDGLWYGEGFNANASPEYMLVEMSGIPFGLMSEMLDHPNAWHGMVFGMRTRWPWSGDPRNVWKLEDRFGITDSEFIGWWDPANPVKTDDPLIKASVFRKQGSTLIALASWAKGRTKVRLGVDWKALGLDPARTTFWAPACEGIQPETVFAADATIPVLPGKGWLLIADEQARQPTPPQVAVDPVAGRRLLGGSEAPLELKVPANTVSTKELPWPAGAGTAVARLNPMRDEGQSWGVGLAVGWPNGKSVQINARTDGRWGVHGGGGEALLGEHPRGTPAEVAIRIGETTVSVLAKEDGAEWESIAEFPRAGFPGAPASVRYGKLGPGWNSRDFGNPGPTHPCRVEWIRLY